MGVSAVISVDVLAFGAHPDDVEIGCGGTLALLARAGRRVGIVHLTRGERGSRGTPAEREDEAQAAARRLSVAALEFLDCGDGGLRTNPQEEDAVIAVLRRYRPQLVLLPPPADRHPDHARAHRLVADACFYAGLVKRAPDGAGDVAIHRPALLLAYELHDPMTPTLIVDISLTFALKQQALDEYRTQLHQPGAAADETFGPPTKVSSPLFREAVAARARHHGVSIGVENGEPFAATSPLPINNLLALVGNTER